MPIGKPVDNRVPDLKDRIERLRGSLKHSNEERYYYQNKYREFKHKYYHLRIWFLLNAFILIAIIIKEFL